MKINTTDIFQKGFTLVELLVSMAIGLFIGLVALTYLVNSSQAYKIHNVDGRIQENAMFALDVLAQNIRMAGFIGDSGENVSILANRDICPDTDGNGNASPCIADSFDTSNSDRIAIELVTRVAMDGVDTTSGNDCAGNLIDNTSDIHFMSVFWVNDGSLTCQSTRLDTGAPVSDPQVLLEGIESMQVQYGVDTDDNESADTFTSFERFPALVGATAGFTDVQDAIRAIKSVRISILLDSGIDQDDQRNTETEEERTYVMLDGPETMFNDRRRRDIFSTTVMLPNASLGRNL